MSPTKEAVSTQNSPAPLPQFSQAVKYNGMVYCSGSIGIDVATKELVKGGVQPETRVAIKNLSAVLEAAGSNLDSIVKVNVFLTTMDDFAPMNQVYDEFFGSINPKPGVTELTLEVAVPDLCCSAPAALRSQDGNRVYCFCEAFVKPVACGLEPKPKRGGACCAPMSFYTGARLVRVQPAHLHHVIQQRTFSVSTIPLRLSLSLSQTHRYTRIASLSSSYSKNASRTQFRSTFASSASQPKSSIASPEKPPPADSELISDPLNPPASTRPPPLDVPARDLSTNLFVYLFRVGKAYTTFYKTGLKAILTNRRLSRNLPAANPTRADVLLYRRVRHDLQRLPLFAVILLV
ncbi:hypothetical protein CIB48_g12241, partial [Xylaria polymorpha]